MSDEREQQPADKAKSRGRPSNSLPCISSRYSPVSVFWSNRLVHTFDDEFTPAKFLEQSLGIFQIGGVEAFGKPVARSGCAEAQPL
jgi:hypothetical protein